MFVYIFLALKMLAADAHTLRHKYILCLHSDILTQNLLHTQNLSTQT